ncbi:MAG: hypothetical protein ABEJ05_03685 [Haloglomus sp.]
MTPGGRTEQTGAFVDALARLQRDGGALLVVGTPPGDTHERACSRMLGSRDQRRVVCLTDGRCSAGPERARPTDRLLEFAADARSAVASGCGDPGGGDAAAPLFDTDTDRECDGTDTDRECDETDPTEVETAAAFGARVAEAVADAADATDLRVCIDSLLPLVDELGEERAFRWFHTAAADVRSAGGVCHAHLPLARENDLVRRFEALVDATVELRLVDGRPEQRWFVHGSVGSDWLPLQG